MTREALRRLVDGLATSRLRRFVAVGTVTAGVQTVLLWVFVDALALNYLLGAVIGIEIAIVLTYVLNNAWTFRSVRNTGPAAFLVGLVKTNVVRGSAIPIQLAVLFVLVEFRQLPYLLSNGIAILLSGVYRFVLDTRWTWGRT
ncbi:MAG: putative membrane protein [uncultured archaeon A07HB70]|nr:MAG: putative membrane protein [uncultured archaeon A07HB70]